LEEADGCALAHIWQPAFAQYDVEAGNQIACVDTSTCSPFKCLNLESEHILAKF